MLVGSDLGKRTVVGKISLTRNGKNACRPLEVTPQLAVGRSGASHRRQLVTGGRCRGSAASSGRCDGSWPRVHSAWLRVGRPLLSKPLLYIAPRVRASSYILLRGPSRSSPTVHRPALRGASRWFLPRSACPSNSVWARMVTGPTSSASNDVHRR